MPNEFKIKGESKKHILREIVHKYIDKTEMDRPKMGFSIPIVHWLSTHLNDKLEFYTSEEFIVKQGIFDFEKITAFKNTELSYINKTISPLWYLFVFQMWYQKWMD